MWGTSAAPREASASSTTPLHGAVSAVVAKLQHKEYVLSSNLRKVSSKQAAMTSRCAQIRKTWTSCMTRMSKPGRRWSTLQLCLTGHDHSVVLHFPSCHPYHKYQVAPWNDALRCPKATPTSETSLVHGLALPGRKYPPNTSTDPSLYVCIQSSAKVHNTIRIRSTRTYQTQQQTMIPANMPIFVNEDINLVWMIWHSSVTKIDIGFLPNVEDIFTLWS